MNNQKKVSVIIPVYNSAEYLTKCVDSIINQTYKNLEIILVDDGSKDESGALCDKYSRIDERVISLHQDNAGPGAARNRALDIAKGDYIAFADSDDYADPDMYLTMIELMESEDADIAVCNFRDALDNSKLSDIDCVVYNRYDALIQRLKTQSISDALWDKIYRAPLWNDIRFPTDRLLSEDSACIYKVLSNAKRVVCINRPFYKVTVRGESLSHKGYSKNLRFTISTYEEMVDFFKDLGEEEFVTIAENSAAGAVFFNVIGLAKSRDVDRETRDFIKKHANKQFKEYKGTSLKRKVLLLLVARFYWLAEIVLSIKH